MRFQLRLSVLARVLWFCLLSVAAVVVMSGCAGPGSFGLSSLPDSKSAAARTYANYCKRCHALPHPGRLSATGWAALYPVMETHMVERNMVLPSDDERQAILSYLQTYAR